MSDRQVLFLDKDGTLIEDLPYNVDPRRVRFAPGSSWQS
jgi:D-glycero-D-manno-heptose 1,7-bisphosphate phosphatase